MSGQLYATATQVGTGQAGVEGGLAGEMAWVLESVDTGALRLTLLQAHVVPGFACSILNTVRSE